MRNNTARIEIKSGPYESSIRVYPDDILTLFKGANFKPMIHAREIRMRRCSKVIFRLLSVLRFDAYLFVRAERSRELKRQAQIEDEGLGSFPGMLHPSAKHLFIYSTDSRREGIELWWRQNDIYIILHLRPAALKLPHFGASRNAIPHDALTGAVLRLENIPLTEFCGTCSVFAPYPIRVNPLS